MTLPDSLAFDSGYHLNQQGVEKNTKRMIEYLRVYFGGDEDEEKNASILGCQEKNSYFCTKFTIHGT